MSDNLLSKINLFSEITPFNFVMGHPVGFNAIKRGSTMECLADLKKAAIKDGVYHHIVCDMMGASEAASRTVYDWFAGKYRPTGMNLLRVWYFLSYRGYQIEDLELLAKNFRLLMEYLVSKKITVKRMVELLDLPNQKALFDIFDGKQEAIDKQTERRAELLCRLLWREERNIMETDSDLATLVAEGLLEPDFGEDLEEDLENED